MDYEQLKSQKMQELQKRQEEEQRQDETEARISAAVKGLLTEQARERLNNVRLVNKEAYFKAVQAILYLQNTGQVQEKINDQELKQLLDRISSKKEIKIRRK